MFSKREKMALVILLILLVSNFTFPQIYFRYPNVDIPAHFLGGFFVALFFIGFLRRSLAAERSLIQDLIIIVGASTLVGVLWEFFELIADLTPPLSIDYARDILLDLAMDITGAAAMFFIVRRRHRKSKMFR
ncbi:MAG: hypothetical protein HY506_01610 [Candidatus Yanofskybacteria bacterium]|nr:hypothetical protein [Candidatus Yanofskybacteria bacterium]